MSAAAALSSLDPTELARERCRAAIEDRFGWLKRRLAEVNGNLSLLRVQEQSLWYGRQQMIARYHGIHHYKPERQEKAYDRLTKEIARR